jgi:hypothetical protein
MKQSISKQDFRNAFNAIRPDNFSYVGLDCLFEYFEDYEESTGEQIELDVIAICCEFIERPIREVLNDYNMFTLCDLYDLTTVIDVSERAGSFSQRVIYRRF